jgi:hypothetical protein
MQLRYVLRDISRWIRRKTGTFGKATGRLDRQRPDRPLPLTHEHVAGAALFATRHDYIASLPKGGVCAEVGVQRGNFSVHILEAAKPRELHLIDMDFTKLGNRFEGNPVAIRHHGLSVEVLASFPDGYFDWIYIDAGHTYKDVRADATMASLKVKPDGLLIFNDYIIWSHHEGYAYGIVQTVNEMCVNEGWRMVAFCLQHNLYCDVALQRRSTRTAD